MANLIILENGVARTTPASHGEELTIKAPCDCDAVTGVRIAGVDYPFYDAAGNAMPQGARFFAKGNLIRVIIDTVNARATIMNPAVTPESIGAAEQIHRHTKSEITDFPTKMTPTNHKHKVSEISDFPTSMKPSAHASTHGAEGMDPITPEMIGALAIGEGARIQVGSYTGTGQQVTASTFKSVDCNFDPLVVIIGKPAPKSSSGGGYGWDSNQGIIFSVTAENTTLATKVFNSLSSQPVTLSYKKVSNSFRWWCDSASDADRIGEQFNLSGTVYPYIIIGR